MRLLCFQRGLVEECCYAVASQEHQEKGGRFRFRAAAQVIAESSRTVDS